MATTKVQAFQRYSRPQKMTTCIQEEDYFYSQYLGAARNVLHLYPVAQISGTTQAVLPKTIEVCQTLSDMLSAPSYVFTEDYYRRPTFPIKFLYIIAEIYGFYSIPADFMSGVFLRDHELAQKSIMNRVWLAFVLGLDTSSTRSIVEKFKQARALLSRRIGGISTVRAAPNPGSSSQRTAPDVLEPVLGPVTPLSQVPHWYSPGPRVSSVVFDAGQVHVQELPSPLTTMNPLLLREARIHEERDIHAFDNSPDWGDTRKANYAHQQFSSRTFTGDLSQSVELLIQYYYACARQHRLTAVQKADYFMNVLEGPARTFLLNHYKPGVSYNQVCELMNREYDSESRQLQVHSTLDGLNLDVFMSAQSLTTHSEVLNKIVGQIELLTPQCPPGFRSD